MPFSRPRSALIDRCTEGGAARVDVGSSAARPNVSKYLFVAVLRHRLHESGGPMDFLMAWVAVPELGVCPSQQRYTFVRREPRGRIVRFQSLDIDFTADIAFDEQGIVLDYPGIARLAA